jgi:methyl-accepting chemotaxis protein
MSSIKVINDLNVIGNLSAENIVITDTLVHHEFNAIKSFAINSYNTVKDTSANWNDAYTAVYNTSANWNTVNDTSANWNDSYNTVKNTSANWNDSYNTVKNTSANWQDVYNTFQSTSSTFLTADSDSQQLSFDYNQKLLMISNDRDQGNAINFGPFLYTSSITSASAAWYDAYNTINNTSANWDNSYNTVKVTSANWNDSYNTINNTSANWDSSYNTINNTSANWDSSYNTINNTSANWDSSYNTVKVTSANWNDSYNTINNTSANWDSSFNAINNSSANWNDSYNTVKNTSANWNDSYNTVKNTSANWQDVYNTFQSTSSTFLTADSDSQQLSFDYNQKILMISNDKGQGNAINFGPFLYTSSITSASAAWYDAYNTVKNTSAYWITDAQVLVFDPNTKQLSISQGNGVDLTSLTNNQSTSAKFDSLSSNNILGNVTNNVYKINASLTLSDIHAGSIIVNDSNNHIDINVPNENITKFTPGTQITIIQGYAGNVRIRPTVQVILQSYNGYYTLRGTHSVCTLYYLGSNVWNLGGDLI